MRAHGELTGEEGGEGQGRA
jgi:hypothetical protein